MALIPPHYLESVFAIGMPKAGSSTQWIATGFLWGKLSKKISETEGEYKVFFVTNRHVIERITGDTMILRFNQVDGSGVRELSLNMRKPDGSNLFTLHPDPDIDIAAAPINAKFLKENGLSTSFFQDDSSFLEKGDALSQGVSEGHGVFVLGYPMGMIGTSRDFPLVRSGCISRIRDYFAGHSKEVLIDCTIFPGNSGGPVVFSPDSTSIEGTNEIANAYLIGVIAGYIPYQDRAVSEQTEKTRVIFEENSGLAKVVPADYIKQVIEMAEKKIP